jgi:hypothetical protein
MPIGRRSRSRPEAGYVPWIADEYNGLQDSHGSLATSTLTDAGKIIHEGPRLRILRSTWDRLLLFGLTTLVMLPENPANMAWPSRDSGVFLYAGWRILSGELPYRDIWDHKPPLIYYLNALGLVVSGGSRWGVWCIEFILLFTAALLG